jgi:hypothetical protein
MLTDPTNDRVDYVAGTDAYPLEQVSYRLGADVPSDAQQATDFGSGATGSSFPRAYGENPSPEPDPSYTDTVSGTAFTVNTSSGWYSEEQFRPYAGFPLVAMPDEEYAVITNETEPVVRREYPDTLATVGVRALPDRRSLDIPDKASRNPASINDERPWDVIMGAWPWTGQKMAMQQPVASLPRFYPQPLSDPIPALTGAGAPYGMVPNTVDLTPSPMTWRLTPTPYDTEQAGYIDAGTGGV